MIGKATLLGLVLSIGAAGAAPASEDPDRWNAGELAVLSSLRLSLLPAPPHDASNAYDQVPAAAALGKRLFSDPRFSADQRVSCATCHDPARQFQDDRALARGIATTARRAMPLVEAGRGPWLFWDGRKDSVWAQALGPLEDAKEHGGNRLRAAHLLQENYRHDYESIFPAMPDLSGLPADGGPHGTLAERAAWDGLTAEEQDAVSRIFANLGKAIAAYERTLHYGPSRLDRYIDGVLGDDGAARQSLTPPEKRGLRLFLGKGDCVSCHNGPLFTDLHFHNTGVTPRDPSHPDPGRMAAIGRVLDDEFNCLGRFSDASPEQCRDLRFIAKDDPRMLGAFKTPSLRNVALRPPYMYAGQLGTLADVIRHYAEAPSAAIGRTERQPVPFTDTEMADLVSFLGSLSGPIVEEAR